MIRVRKQVTRPIQNSYQIQELITVFWCPFCLYVGPIVDDSLSFSPWSLPWIWDSLTVFWVYTIPFSFFTFFNSNPLISVKTNKNKWMAKIFQSWVHWNMSPSGPYIYGVGIILGSQWWSNTTHLWFLTVLGHWASGNLHFPNFQSPRANGLLVVIDDLKGWKIE